MTHPHNNDTPKSVVVDSSLKVKEHESSRASAEADLKVPDPKPERAKALLEGESNG